jgi:hypothetical protein
MKFAPRLPFALLRVACPWWKFWQRHLTRFVGVLPHKYESYRIVSLQVDQGCIIQSWKVDGLDLLKGRPVQWNPTGMSYIQIDVKAGSKVELIVRHAPFAAILILEVPDGE